MPITPVAAANPQPGTASAILTTGGAGAALAEAQALLQQNQLVAALEKLSASFDSPSLSADDDRRIMELLDQLAGTVIYSREHLLLPAHTVRPGERLDQIAAQYKTSWELLAKINGIQDPANLSPGTQLKVIPGPFDALVDKSRRRMSVFLDGMYAGSFPIGFGRDRPAVDGQYVVNGKTPNPAYFGPDLQLPADDPHNPLGERLLDLGNGQVIHGTSEPADLANDDARGCIRLSARDSEDVYDILTPGSQVIIRP
jgi:lipoprotein-anchoring transpeptidase ErfK/SrfK